MEKDDLLLAFTDGIPDALNADNLSFENQRLLQIVTGVEKEPAALLKTVAESLHQFIGAAEQFDDITVLAVKRRALPHQ